MNPTQVLITEEELGKRFDDSPLVTHDEFGGFLRRVNGAVIYFRRNEFKTPTEEAIIDYRKRSEQVNELGGRMILREFEIAGENPFYTEADIESLRTLVEQELAKRLPEMCIVDSWNGVGCLTVSFRINWRK